jgi:outer membrane lipoprotein-sorting protein
LRYTAERNVRSASGSAKEVWSFSYAEPESFRIECRQPVERILVANHNTSWEYVPAIRKAMKTDLSEMAEDARRQFLAGILSRVAIDGIRIGKYDDIAKRAVSFSRLAPTGEVVRIEGTNPRYVMDLDTKQNVMNRMEIYDDQGQCLLRTVATDFVNILPGVWYPTHVRIECKSDKGILTTEVRLRGIEANIPIPEGSFEFRIPHGVTVETPRSPTK